MTFTCCPACGGRLGDYDRDGSVTCPHCGRTWYDNPSPTVGAVIVSDEGKALVTVRARDPHAGLYDIPGGFLHTGESFEAGLQREVREELGIDIETSMTQALGSFPHTYRGDDDWIVAVGLTARVVGEADLEPTDDVAEARWVTAEELEELDFAWEHDKEMVRRALADG